MSHGPRTGPWLSWHSSVSTRSGTSGEGGEYCVSRGYDASHQGTTKNQSTKEQGAR
jgi:hypothetical protein